MWNQLHKTLQIYFNESISPCHSVKIFKNSQRQSRVMRICHFQAQNDPFVLNKFFWQKPLLLLSSNYWSSSLWIFFKKSYNRYRVMMCHFWVQNDPFAPNKFFLDKIVNIIFLYVLVPFIVQNFKKILPADPELWDASLLGLKWPICPNEIFFIKCFKKPCFFHLCLSTCQNRNWSVKGYLR